MSDQDPVVHIVDELRPVVEHLDASYRDLVGRELARNGLDDPDLAEAVYAALGGLVLHHTVFPDEARTTRALTALRRLLAADAGLTDSARNS